MTSRDTPNAISSPEAGSGPLQLDLLGGPMTSPSGPDHARASRSARQAKAAALLMSGICGPTFTDLSEPSGPMSWWENRLRVRLGMVGSTESPLIWRRKVTPAGRSIFRLAPWTPPTSGNGCIGWRWPTPDCSTGGPDPSSRATGKSLQTYLANWSTPRASDGEKGGPNQSFGAGGQPLPAQMHQASPWVTPSSRDWKDSPGMATERSDGRSRLDQLPRQMVATDRWATPQHRDHFPPHTPEYIAEKKALGHGMRNLNDEMALSGQTTNGSRATTEKRGAPNPGFAMWLMSFPDQWIAVSVLALLRMGNTKS